GIRDFHVTGVQTCALPIYGRLMAAQLLGLDEVPVDYQDYANEAEEWADLIADNRLAELSEMDNEMLKDLIQEIDSEEFDLTLTGFEEDEKIGRASCRERVEI